MKLHVKTLSIVLHSEDPLSEDSMLGQSAPGGFASQKMLSLKVPPGRQTMKGGPAGRKVIGRNSKLKRGEGSLGGSAFKGEFRGKKQIGASGIWEILWRGFYTITVRFLSIMPTVLSLVAVGSCVNF